MSETETTAGRRPGSGRQTVRIAMIGAGRMANSVHYPSLASFDDVEIAAVCDLNLEALRSTADRYGIEGRYTDYREMVSRVAPDGVYVIGQPHLMYDIWAWCLKEGLNLYVEKPLGLTWHQAQMLAYLLEKLQDAKDGEGTLLDHSLVLFGGGMGDGNLHRHADLPCLMAGRLGGAFTPGRHTRYAMDTPMSNLLLTILDAGGVPIEKLGDSTSRLPLNLS